MISLIYLEIKKLWKNKFYLFLFFFLMIVPLSFTISGSLKESIIDDNGEVVSGMKAIKKRIQVEKMLSGEVTEEWQKRNFDLYKKLLPDYLDSVMDKEKMEEVYGKGYEEKVLSDFIHNHFTQEKMEYEIYYRSCENTETCIKRKNSLSLQKIDDAITYGEFILNKKWETYSKADKHYLGIGEDGNPAYSIEPLTKELIQEEAMIKESFRNTPKFYYGEMEILNLSIQTLSNSGVLLGYFMLLLFSSIFNKEEKDEQNALLKSTKNGKRKLALAKIGAVLIVSMVLPILLSFLCIGVLILLFGTPDYFSSYQLLTGIRYMEITHFTYIEVYIKATLLLMVGSITIASFSAFLSSFLKSSYRSLMIGFLLLLIPLFLGGTIGTFPLKLLAPIEYMNVNPRLLIDVATISGVSFYKVDFILKSVIVPILLLPFALLKDMKKEVTNA